MTKQKTGGTLKPKTGETYGIKGGEGKRLRSAKTGQYVQGSVKSSIKTQAHSEKNIGAVEIKRTNDTALAVGRIKNAWQNSAVMSLVAIKPESRMTSIEKMEATREGISKKALEELKDKAGFDYDQLAQVLGVARTTLLNKKGNEKFPPGLSEKIMSLADLYSFGYEIFGDPEEFNQWIFQSLPALGGQAPYALLNNQYGREEVKNLIGRIAYGAYS